MLGIRDEKAALNIILEALRLFGLNLNMPSQRVATAGRKTAWGPGVRRKSAKRVLRHLGRSRKNQRRTSESLSSTFDVAEAGVPVAQACALTSAPGVALCTTTEVVLHERGPLAPIWSQDIPQRGVNSYPDLLTNLDTGRFRRPESVRPVSVPSHFQQVSGSGVASQAERRLERCP